MTWTIELELDGDIQTIQGGDFISTPSWQSEPSAITTWEATVPWSPSLEEWTRSEARIYFDDTLLLTGEFNDVESFDSSNETRLTGDDDIKDLERGGASVTFESIEVHEAIREYADEHLEEWTVTVTDPDIDSLDEDKVVQEADTTAEFEGIVDTPDTKPVVVDNDSLRLAQTGFFFEGENPDSESGTGTVVSDDDYSGGEGREVVDTGDELQFNFDLDYDVPDGELVVAFRRDTRETDDSLGFAIELNGDVIESVPRGVLSQGLTWFRAFPTLSEGSHTLTIDIDPDAEGGDGWVIDGVAVYDDRYTDTSDNEVHEPGGYLDGPQLKPDAVTVETVLHDDDFNIIAANLNTSINDTSGPQRLQVSNDGGDNWLPDDGSELNTEAINTNLDSVGSTIKGRVTLGRFGERDTATPRKGFESQAVDSWELRVDTNSLAVIEEREYTGSHFENLQRLHDDGNMVFVPEYVEGEKRLESFTIGDVEASAEWTREDHSRRLDVSDYANSITVFGAEDEDGNRLTATARSQGEIDRVGEEIEATPQFRDRIESQDQLRAIARNELSQLIAEDRLSGSVEIVPKPLQPGKSYEVPILDETLPLWSVTFDDSRGGNGSLQFGEPDDLAAALTSIKSEVRETKG